MQNDRLQFYPTPPELAKELWSLFKNREFVRVLDPEVGEGHLAEVRPDSGWRNPIPVDGCEIDVSKHQLLREKNINVVGLDFLKFQNGHLYSHFILNPPFSVGVTHLLHAWDIAWDAEFSCVLNAESVRNPYTKERERLAQLIAKHGSVYFKTGAFAGDDAERKTAVDIAIVYLRKKADVDNEIYGDLIGQLRQDSGRDRVSDDINERLEVALPNSDIENMVLAFNAAVQSMKDAAKSQAKASYYAALLGDTMATRNGDEKVKSSLSTVFNVRSSMVAGYDDLKDRAWAGVLRSTNVVSRLSSEAKRRLESEFETIKKLEFSVENIYGFICGLVENSGKIQLEMVCDIFDLITKYHSDNTCFYMGWKSNDRHRVGARRIRHTRFILPGFSRDSVYNSLGSDQEKMLEDIDKVTALLDGKVLPEVGLRDLFNNQFRALRASNRLSATYFDIRWFPGRGTIHFFPKSQEVMDKLNRYVGRHRGWLPGEGERVCDDFWLQYNQADKIDKELRSEIAKNWKRSGWHDPLSMVGFPHRDHYDEAMSVIESSLSTVLTNRGINPQFQLAQQPMAQLTLLAA